MAVLDVNDRVLRAICDRAGHDRSAVVDVRPLIAALGLDPVVLFHSVLALVDTDFLDYVAAGPKVRVTSLGARRCHGLKDPLPQRIHH